MSKGKSKPVKIVGIRFSKIGKSYYFDASKIADIAIGDFLVVQTSRGWQIGEVPIVFEDRRMGTTKISRQEIFKAQYTVLRLFLRRLRRKEPRRPAIPVSQQD